MYKDSYRLSGSFSPGPAGNSIIDLKVENGIVYSAADQGIAMTQDKGSSWITSTHDQGVGKGGVSAIDIEDDVIWIATGFDTTTDQGGLPAGGGVGFSTDFGESWKWFRQPIDSVNVEYWTTGMRHVNDSMVNATGDAIWSYSVSLQDINTDLFYRFHATDTKGNENGTETFMREVRGEVYPILWNDMTPSIASPSTLFTFQIDATDNHELDEVKVEFWVGSGQHSSNTMERLDTTDTYTFETMVPNVVDQNLYYFFSARDNDLKWNRTGERSIPIIDILRPVFLYDSSDTTGNTGEEFSFAISVSDNLHLTNVSAEYWFDAGPTTRRTPRMRTKRSS